MVYNREKMAAAMRGIMEVMLGVILVGFVDHVKLAFGSAEVKSPITRRG